MPTGNLKLIRRLSRLEDLTGPQSTRSMTLEELCRSMWRQHKPGFIELAKNNSYQLFVYQFEREDADAASLNGRSSNVRQQTRARRHPSQGS